ncbi:MAG: hypothetical protein KA248_10470 [Kiritimatiellae bacterium]|nr:hypothetical protein [Kiritimatiellia bacterium]
MRPSVWLRHEHLLRCPACGTIFWRGSHVRDTRHKPGWPPPHVRSR